MQHLNHFKKIIFSDYELIKIPLNVKLEIFCNFQQRDYWRTVRIRSYFLKLQYQRVNLQHYKSSIFFYLK